MSKPYLIDPFVRFIHAHMKYEQNRNIIKLNAENGICLVYTGKNKWKEVKDADAIPFFISKYYVEYNSWLLKRYNKIDKDTEALEVGDIITNIEMVELIDKHDPSYCLQLYKFICMMLEDVCKEWFPERLRTNG